MYMNTEEYENAMRTKIGPLDIDHKIIHSASNRIFQNGDILSSSNIYFEFRIF